MTTIHNHSRIKDIIAMMQPTEYHQFFSLSLKRPLVQNDLSQIAQLYVTLDDGHLWKLAVSNKVDSVVAEALHLAFGKEPIHWQEAFVNASSKMSCYLTELDRLSEVLASQGFSAIVLENGALARGIISVPGCFHFGDFELLIDPHRIDVMHRLLLDQGYSCNTTCNLVNDKPNFTNGRIEYERTIDFYALRLNIQTSFVARKWVYPWREPSSSELFERSRSILQSHIRILGAEDFLLQLCVHNASHGFIHKPGIRLHMDVDWYIRATSVNWDRFMDLVKQYNAKTIAFLALSIPKAIWNTPIPANVLSQLRISPWKEPCITYFLRKVDLLNPGSSRLKLWQYAILNLLFLDNLRDVWPSIFPERAWMREHYGFKSNLLLPLYHGRRIANLVFRRVSS